VQKRDEVVGTPRWLRRVVSAALAFAFHAALPAVSRACTREQLALTCSRDQIEPTSYRLVTEAVALSRTRATYDFWDRFDLLMGAPALPSARAAILFAAERAYELDARNQMAHATLAREYLFDGQREMAEAAWHRVLVAGGSVVWTARVPALDPREPVLVAAGTGGLRLYRIPGLRARLDDATGAIWESLASRSSCRTPRTSPSCAACSRGIWTPDVRSTPRTEFRPPHLPPKVMRPARRPGRDSRHPAAIHTVQH
jgi:hypothetical protein